MSQTLIGSLSILITAIIYAFFGILARFIGFSIPLFYQNITRNVLATMILAIMLFAAKKNKWKPMTPYAWKIVIIRAFMGATSFLLFFYTMNNMPIGMAYFLYYGANTFLGYLLGNLLFREKITPMKRVAFLLAICGMALTFLLNIQDVSLVLFGAAVLSGSLCAGWFVIVKKLPGYSGKQLTFFDSLLPIVIYCIGSIATKEHWTMPQLTPTWIASLSYGALFVITGQLIIYGYHRVEAQIGSLILLIEIPIAALLAYLFYHEPITLKTTLGGILILIAMTLPHIQLFSKKHVS